MDDRDLDPRIPCHRVLAVAVVTTFAVAVVLPLATALYLFHRASGD